MDGFEQLVESGKAKMHKLPIFFIFSLIFGFIRSDDGELENPHEIYM